MNTRVRLSRYERGIVDCLVDRHGYSKAVARDIVVRYIAVIRAIGGYDNDFDHAERLDRAMKTGYTPEAWMDRIQMWRIAAAKDPGIIPHQRLAR